MFRKQYSLSQRLLAAVALALGASGVALADDSSMGRFGGDSYSYFNRPMVGNSAASPSWRQSNPNGLSELELQALSSNDLSAFASRINPPTFASAPADPNWRIAHPNGFTERELQALSASSLAFGPLPTGFGESAALSNLAQSPSKETHGSRLINLFHSGSDAKPSN